MSEKIKGILSVALSLIVVDSASRHAYAQHISSCDTVYRSVSVEVPAKPAQDLNKFFREHLSIDTTCFVDDMAGTFLFSMILTKEGKVVDPVVLRPALAPSCEKAIEELLLQIPAFIPARRQGKAVCSVFKIPLIIHFQ